MEGLNDIRVVRDVVTKIVRETQEGAELFRAYREGAGSL